LNVILIALSTFNPTTLNITLEYLITHNQHDDGWHEWSAATMEKANLRSSPAIDIDDDTAHRLSVTPHSASQLPSVILILILILILTFSIVSIAISRSGS